MSVRFMRRLVAVSCATSVVAAASLAAAPTAGASTIYVCVKKKSGVMRLVDRKAKCKRGESKLTWNQSGPAGPAGKTGATGATGTTGSGGSAGLNGAVAGFSASEPNEINIAGSTVTILSKSLPAGSYIISADVGLKLFGEETTKKPGADIECFLTDGSSEVGGIWGGGTTVELGSKQFIADGSIPLQLAITTTSTTTVKVECEAEILVQTVEVGARNTTLVAIQTSKNS
jgi:hypothetical protein